MRKIKPLVIDVGDIWEPPGLYGNEGSLENKESLCLYFTLLKPASAAQRQLAKDLRLAEDDESPLLAVTMAGWVRAPHIPALECFSYEVIAKVPASPNDLPIAQDPAILFEIMVGMFLAGAHEVCRQRVFRHDEKASHDNMVRVSALKPGVPFIERLGENEGIDIRGLPSRSRYQRTQENDLLKPGVVLIDDGSRPFESVIEKPRKPSSGSHDFTCLPEFYDKGYALFEKAKKTLKTLKHLSREEQRKNIETSYGEIDAFLIDRMLDGNGYLSTTSYLAAEWAGLRCGLAADRHETEYPVTYLMQVLTKLNKEKERKQIYFVRNSKTDEVN
jgi:hypothetical protein